MAKPKKDPGEDIRQLNQVISSGEFRNVHLLCGAEDYLRLQFKDKLVKAMGGKPGSMSFDKFVGKDVVAEQIIDLAETMPFFTDHRVILLENTGWFKSGNEAMAKYIEQGVCDSTYIVFCEKETDKKTKIYKTVAAAGLVSSFDEQDESTLRTWLISNAGKLGSKLSGGDANYMINLVGTDMVCLSNELAKLTAYCLERGQITKEDIDAVCSRKLEDKVFEMCDDIALKRSSRTFALYYDLLANREEPIKILVLITRHFDLLMKIKSMEMKRQSDVAIGAAIHRPDWTIKNYRAQTSHYTLERLKEIVNLCAQTDENIKTGRMTDQVALEMLLVELTQA